MHPLISVCGALSSIEIEIATSHSKTPEIEQALRDAEKNVSEAIANLRKALTTDRRSN